MPIRPIFGICEGGTRLALIDTGKENRIMMSVILPLAFFLLILTTIYGISLVCFKGVAQIIAHGADQLAIRRPVNVRDQDKLNVRVY